MFRKNSELIYFVNALETVEVVLKQYGYKTKFVFY